jgi:hypothetical protein
MDKHAAYELGARLALQEAEVAEEYYPHTKEAAFHLGVGLAMKEAGLVKEGDEAGSAVWPALFGAPRWWPRRS